MSDERRRVIDKQFVAYFGEDYDDHYADLVDKLDRALAEATGPTGDLVGERLAVLDEQRAEVAATRCVECGHTYAVHDWSTVRRTDVGYVQVKPSGLCRQPGCACKTFLDPF